jgi:hypothetical protein
MCTNTFLRSFSSVCLMKLLKRFQSQFDLHLFIYIIMEGVSQGSIAINEDSARSPTHPVPTNSTTVDTQHSKSRACVACREKHLKCDGLNRCTRCSAQNITCVYLKSRRGYRGRDIYAKHVSKQICSSNL